MRNLFTSLVLLCSLPSLGLAFNTPTKSTFRSTSVLRQSVSDGDAGELSRRSLLNKLALVPFVVGLSVPVNSALASGGATAGGAYLLSAKQRYNERVKASVQGLLAVGEALEAGSSKEAKEYFSSEAGGSWKDMTAAGYLLSNAFRRSSTTPPDSLPAVKKYKAFAAEVDGLQKALKKKGASAASASFPAVEAALETWLSEIELPSAREL